MILLHFRQRGIEPCRCLCVVCCDLQSERRSDVTGMKGMDFEASG